MSLRSCNVGRKGREGNVEGGRGKECGYQVLDFTFIEKQLPIVTAYYECITGYMVTQGKGREGKGS